MTPEVYLTIEEAAAELKFSERTVRRMIADGDFRPVRWRRGRYAAWRIPRSQIDAFMANGVAPILPPSPPPFVLPQRRRVPKFSSKIAPF